MNAAPHLDESERFASTAKTRILVVEDDPDLLTAVVRIAAGLGTPPEVDVEVDGAPTLEVARELLRGDPYDLILAAIVSRLARSVSPGVIVDWSLDVDEAKTNLERHTYDVVLADHMLRGYQRGLDLYDWCGHSGNRAFFTMMSALSVPEIGRVVESRQLPFLTKPFTTLRCREFLSMALA